MACADSAINTANARRNLRFSLLQLFPPASIQPVRRWLHPAIGGEFCTCAVIIQAYNKKK
jgi:hypothetical protein